ncbi:MAG: sulfotransferase domain-containing protein [Verrucomicrobiota bacterium]
MSIPQGERKIENPGIVWLASFPKSGNTWFRIVLSSLLSDPLSSIRLDGIGFPMPSARAIFDHVVGVDSSDLTFDEIDALRPRYCEDLFHENREEHCFFKTHDAYTYLPDGQPLISERVTAGAIYLIRNPLDVAVSTRFHDGANDFDRIIERMGDAEYALGQDRFRLRNQLRQKLLGWSGHVRSWQRAEIPVHFMRFEDMKLDPVAQFGAAVEFSGIQKSRSEIEAAVEQSQFENLQAKEKEGGFKEKPSSAQTFFRQGKTGSWREHLSDEQATRVIEDHEMVMREFGYLDADGNPVF